MRVLQLGPYSPPHGGVRANLLAIHRVLREHGVQSSVVNLTGVRRANTGCVFYPRNALEVLWHLLRRRNDILHLHLGGMLTARELALAAVCCLIPWCKAVLTYHSGGYPNSKPGKHAHRWTLRGWIFRQFDAVIAVNRAIEDLFITFGVARRRIHVIPPFALEVPADGAQLPAALEHFFERHRPVLVTVGLLEPEYDLMRQINVFTKIRNRLQTAGLVLIGEGSLHAQLADCIERHPYRNDMVLSGDLEHTAALLAIARSDVLLRTTLYDGDSIAVREALHAGTPVVATDNGMRPDGVRLIREHDDSLCHELEQALAHPPARPASRGPDDRYIEAVVNVYRTLLAAQEARNVGQPGISPRT